MIYSFSRPTKKIERKGEGEGRGRGERERERERGEGRGGEGEGEKGETYIEKAWLCERRRGEHNRVLLESSKPTERKVEAEAEGERESRRTLKKREAIALRTGKRRA